jgi:dCTP diphosphatase
MKRSLDDLIRDILKFRDERDWEQFHTPKDLAAAIAIESAELQERFLWKSEAQISADLADPAKREKVIQEMADVLIFTLLLADRLGVSVDQAILRKLALNAEKYPVAQSRGTARKYDELLP